MKIASLIAAYLVLVDGKPDGREQQMRRERLYTPRHRQEMNAPWNRGGHARHLMDPPLAPSFERLQNLVDDVSQEKSRTSSPPSDADVSKMLPCLLRKEGCTKSDTSPKETKQDSHSDGQLRKTQASIEQAVSKLQKDLDRRTAEVVKEIERRAAEMRREIAIEAEELIEAVKYLVTMLADSVTRADEMGQNFVREWYDDAEKRYVGGGNAAPLDEQIKNLDKDLKETNQDAHKEMVGDLKQSVENTRKYYGAPHSDDDMPLDEQLGLDEEDADSETSETAASDDEENSSSDESSGDSSERTTEKPVKAEEQQETSASDTSESEDTTESIEDTTRAETVAPKATQTVRATAAPKASETAKATGSASVKETAEPSGTDSAQKTASVTTTPATDESNGSVVTGIAASDGTSTDGNANDDVQASADESGKKLTSFGLF